MFGTHTIDDDGQADLPTQTLAILGPFFLSTFLLTPARHLPCHSNGERSKRLKREPKAKQAVAS